MPKGHEKELSKTSASPLTDFAKETRDISNILLILDNQEVKTNPFGANVTGENSYRRAERIGAALHLITNHIPESEPLRSGVRKAGLNLLSQILELRTGFRTPASEKGQTALASLRELISLVRLLAVAGFVSPQNVHTVSGALDELGSLIVVSQRSTLAEQTTITRDDLTPPMLETSLSRTARQHLPERRTRRRRGIKDITDEEGSVSDTPTSTRADQIMDILKVGGILGIKDISVNLPQYSEKMIQRELADLVSAQRVTKLGAKRWSKYHVVSQGLQGS